LHPPSRLESTIPLRDADRNAGHFTAKFSGELRDRNGGPARDLNARSKRCAAVGAQLRFLTLESRFCRAGITEAKMTMQRFQAPSPGNTLASTGENSSRPTLPTPTLPTPTLPTPSGSTQKSKSGEGDEAPLLTLVVPVYNEVGSLPELIPELRAGAEATGHRYEMIFVNDGSSDGSGDWLDRLAAQDPNVLVIHFRKNFGKSPALAAAFARARGRIVLTLDADLQDDPAMIPIFVKQIDDGADLVSGWKQRRHDPIDKTLPSRVFNLIVRRLSGVSLHDFNCGYKAYRIECIRELSVYGGFHRFMPVLAAGKGFKVRELVVQHRARKHGVSKFGIFRFYEGIVDLLTILMLTRFRTRPAHLFGTVAAVFGGVGGTLLIYLTVLWLFDHPIGTRPLLMLGVFLSLSAIQFLAIGLLAELLVRTTITPGEIFSIRAQVHKDAPNLSLAGQPPPALVAASAAQVVTEKVEAASEVTLR
jgi:glycosyltransferase involved in cell wall biosynthesis